jgi:hypothetical protein
MSATVPVVTDDMGQPDAALAIAAAGMYVFPLDHPELPQCAGIGQGHSPKTCDQRGKCPVVKWGSGASTSVHNIHHWWSGNPRNIGIHCGKSGLVVIDEDKLGAFKRYADEHGVKIPRTLVVRTAKGRHYYFVAPADSQLGNEAGALKDYSIDVRAGNGYVVAPGSVHASGVVYRIEVSLPVALPDWVVQAIKVKTNSHKDADGVWETVGGDFERFELPEVIKDHTRDTTLFQYASSLLARGLPRGEAEILMRAAWQRCEQPPKATSAYTVEQALAKLDRYEPGRSEGYEPRGGGEKAAEPATFDSLVAKEAVKIRVREAAQRKVRTEQRRDLGNLEPIRLTEFLATPDEPTQYRIDSLWPTGGRIVLAAQFKAGKPQRSTTLSDPSPTATHSWVASTQRQHGWPWLTSKWTLGKFDSGYAISRYGTPTTFMSSRWAARCPHSTFLIRRSDLSGRRGLRSRTLRSSIAYDPSSTRLDWMRTGMPADS